MGNIVIVLLREGSLLFTCSIVTVLLKEGQTYLSEHQRECVFV